MIITHAQARGIDSISRSQRERLVLEGRYPKPVRLTDRRLGFVKDEVLAWAAARIADRDRAIAAKAAPQAAPSATRADTLPAQQRVEASPDAEKVVKMKAKTLAKRRVPASGLREPA